MNALEPGLYKATVNGVPDVTVMKGRDEAAYLVSTGHLATRRINSGPLTDARPLIVLDLDDPERLVTILRANCLWGLADQIAEQTKPARIPEPGLWGVVEASSTYVDERVIYMHTEGIGLWAWTTQARGSCKWDDLIDPILVREGIAS